MPTVTALYPEPPLETNKQFWRSCLEMFIEDIGSFIDASETVPPENMPEIEPLPLKEWPLAFEGLVAYARAANEGYLSPDVEDVEVFGARFRAILADISPKTEAVALARLQIEMRRHSLAAGRERPPWLHEDAR